MRYNLRVRALGLAPTAVDAVVLSLSYVAAFVLRYEFHIPVDGWRRILFTLPYVVGLEMFCLSMSGFSLVSWRFVSLPAMRRALFAMSAATFLLVLTRIATSALSVWRTGLTLLIVPFGVTFINIGFAFLAILGVRVLRRALAERSDAAGRVFVRAQHEEPKRT